MNFHFLRPAWFLLFVPTIVLAVLLWRRRKNNGAWQQVISAAFLPYLLSVKAEKTQSLFLTSLFVSWFIGVLALAGPTCSRIQMPLVKNVRAAAIVLSLAKSMDAQDVSPSRLERAKMKLKDVITNKPDGLAALVVYAGDAHVVAPLSSDFATIDALISSLSTEIMPIQGNDIEAGIDKARQLLAAVGGKDILLIADGISDDKIEKISEMIAKGRYRLSVLGVGTEQGSPVTDGEGGFFKDETGKIIITKANMQNLRNLATDNGGSWLTVHSSDADFNDALWGPAYGDNHAIKSEHLFDEWHDLGYLFILLLLPGAALLFRKGQLICVALLILSTKGMAWSVGDLFLNKEQRGVEALKSRDYERAKLLLSDSSWRGISEFEEKNYKAAEKKFSAGDSDDDHYNRGNALAAQGKIEEAIAAYGDSLARNPQHEDAKFNKDLLEKLKQEQNKQDKKDENKSDSQEQGKQEKPQNEKNTGEEEQKKNHQSTDPGQEQQKREQQEQQQQQKKAEQPTDTKDRSEKNKAEDEDAEKRSAEKKRQEGKDKEAEPIEVDPASLEEQRAMEQMLRRIPDDPGGLLRRKFYFESQERLGKLNGRK